MTQALPRYKSVILCCLLLVEGFILMGFEMLASRFMNPYFGSSIETWACIISVVLCSMAIGYFVGGYLSVQKNALRYLPVVTLISGVYLILVSYFAAPILLWVIVTFDVSFFSTFSAAVALLAAPVFFMSFWSPMVIGLLSQNTKAIGSVAGYVYGLSTCGNVLGTLGTAFVLVPSFGSSTISFYFGLIMLAITAFYTAVFLIPMRNITTAAGVFLMIGLMPPPPAEAQVRYGAKYPEGIFIDTSDRFFFTEMTGEVITRVQRGKRTVFKRFRNCGPTGFTRLSPRKFAVACHLDGSIRILNNRGRSLRVIRASDAGVPLRNPNDINHDGRGGAFFSDPGPFTHKSGAVGRVYRLAPNGRVSLVTDRLIYPNGVAYDGVRNALLVSEHLQKRVIRIPLDQRFQPRGKHRILVNFKGYSFLGGRRSLNGPDGLRILPNGDLAVALYGSGRIAIAGPCGSAKIYSGFPRFVTSVGYLDGTLVVAGAKTNQTAPFPGQVISTSFTLPTNCV